jgi:hypothetical protein
MGELAEFVERNSTLTALSVRNCCKLDEETWLQSFQGNSTIIEFDADDDE